MLLIDHYKFLFFLKALLLANKLTSSLQKSTIVISLLEVDNYILESELNTYTDIYLFRGSNINIEIRPFQRAFATIYLKTARFFIFISSRMTLSNITIDGTDLNLKRDNLCKNLKKSCCDAEKLKKDSECGLTAEIPIGFGFSFNANFPKAFINLEVVYNEEKNSLVVPELLIINCTFINFVSLSLIGGYSSLIASERGGC
jgi:hypothetical protein